MHKKYVDYAWLTIANIRKLMCPVYQKFAIAKICVNEFWKAGIIYPFNRNVFKNAKKNVQQNGQVKERYRFQQHRQKNLHLCLDAIALTMKKRQACFHLL